MLGGSYSYGIGQAQPGRRLRCSSTSRHLPGEYGDPDNEIRHALQTNFLNLVPVPPVLSVERLSSIIRRNPAVFFVRLRNGQHASNGGNKHVIVVRGLRGDGSANTNINVNDPWTNGGAIRTLSFLTDQYWSSIDYIARRY